MIALIIFTSKVVSLYSEVKIRGGTSHGSARISARAGRARASSARSSSEILNQALARLARARKFLMRFWLGSLELVNL